MLHINTVYIKIKVKITTECIYDFSKYFYVLFCIIILFRYNITTLLLYYYLLRPKHFFITKFFKFSKKLNFFVFWILYKYTPKLYKSKVSKVFQIKVFYFLVSFFIMTVKYTVNKFLSKIT